MEPPLPSHRFAVAFGALAVLASAAWHVRALLMGAADPLATSASVALVVLAALPAVLLAAGAVALALRRGWHRTAGLLLLAVNGLLAVRGLATLGLLPRFADDPGVPLTATAVLAAIASGFAAVLALRVSGPVPLRRPLLGPVRASGWRLVAAGAAAALVLFRLAEVAGDVLLSAPWVLVGGLASAAAAVVVAVAALRVVEGRVVALVVALPGAEAFAEAVTVAVQLVQLQQAPADVTVQPMTGAAVQIVAAATLALAAGALWAAHRPLRPFDPLAAPAPEGADAAGQ